MMNYDKRKNQAGFTLIELAISTIIVGILMAAVAYPYSIWLEKKKLEETSQNVEQMAWVISAFRSANGYYPCPAPMDAPRDSNEYGYQTNCTVSVVAAGSCSAAGNQYCVADGARNNVLIDLDYDISTPDTRVNPTVRIGTIPFRELNMPEEFAYDAYGNRILYAVTEGMAFDNINNHPKAGGIDIIYKDNYAANSTSTRLDAAGSANFVVLSHGADKVGGFDINGNLTAAACDEATSDGENCDHIDGAGVNATFYISEIVEAAGDDRHDDIALFQLPLNAPLWARSTVEASDIYSIKSDANPTGQVGSDYLFNYYTDPAHSSYSANAYDKTRVWVGGNIKIESVGAGTGQAQAFQICDREGENCFQPEIIGGAGIACGATGAMKGVIEGATDCETLAVQYHCPGNEVVKSIDNGIIDCAPLPCAATTKTSCSQSFGLPASASGQSYSYRAGDSWKCSRGTFTCNDGNWDGRFNGMCNCTPRVVPYTRSCPSGCTSGIIRAQTVTDCATCNIYDRQVSDTCVCPPVVPPTTPPVVPPTTPPVVPPTTPPSVPPPTPPVITPPPCSGGTGPGC